ncbi:MAG: family 20 glycosylhydrolase [Enterococcus sp.]
MKKILSIDAGRKYFSKDQLLQIIDRANKQGYTGLSLVLGNNGLRFLLDDMTILINDQKYTSEEVKTALIRGTKNYYDDPNGVFLTETEMDEILYFASTNEMEVIPVINSPGHMDAILEGMTQLGIQNPRYKQSIRTIDLSNDQALHFTKGLIEKYIAYFSNFSKIFNIGCDEYANDLNDGGWRSIQQTGEYRLFVEYVNELVQLVKAYKMKPMVFNDGIYYQENETYGTFDPSLLVAYWTAGWSNYDVSSAKFLISKGHQLLNTNDHWYWVIGRKTKKDGQYHLKSAKEGLKTISDSFIVGSESEVPVLGSMVGIWADDPEADFNMSDLFELLETQFEIK